jgi:hypothetical protein
MGQRRTVRQVRAVIRRLYGAGPLHLALMTALTAVIGYVGIRWWDIGAVHLIVWVGGSVMGHDVVILPAYVIADRALILALRRQRWLIQYLRVPAAMSLLLLAVWWPLILNEDPARRSQTGLGTGPFLGRWLGVTALAFAVSAALAAAAALRNTRRQRSAHQDLSAAHVAIDT